MGGKLAGGPGGGKGFGDLLSKMRPPGAGMQANLPPQGQVGGGAPPAPPGGAAPPGGTPPPNPQQLQQATQGMFSLKRPGEGMAPPPGPGGAAAPAPGMAPQGGMPGQPNPQMMQQMAMQRQRKMLGALGPGGQQYNPAAAGARWG